MQLPIVPLFRYSLKIMLHVGAEAVPPLLDVAPLEDVVPPLDAPLEEVVPLDAPLEEVVPLDAPLEEVAPLLECVPASCVVEPELLEVPPLLDEPPLLLPPLDALPPPLEEDGPPASSTLEPESSSIDTELRFPMFGGTALPVPP